MKRIAPRLPTKAQTPPSNVVQDDQSSCSAPNSLTEDSLPHLKSSNDKKMHRKAAPKLEERTKGSKNVNDSKAIIRFAPIPLSVDDSSEQSDGSEGSSHKFPKSPFEMSKFSLSSEPSSEMENEESPPTKAELQPHPATPALIIPSLIKNLANSTSPDEQKSKIEAEIAQIEQQISDMQKKLGQNFEDVPEYVELLKEKQELERKEANNDPVKMISMQLENTFLRDYSRALSEYLDFLDKADSDVSQLNLEIGDFLSNGVLSQTISFSTAKLKSQIRKAEKARAQLQSQVTFQLKHIDDLFAQYKKLGLYKAIEQQNKDFGDICQSISQESEYLYIKIEEAETLKSAVASITSKEKERIEQELRKAESIKFSSSLPEYSEESRNKFISKLRKETERRIELSLDTQKRLISASLDESQKRLELELLRSEAGFNDEFDSEIISIVQDGYFTKLEGEFELNEIRKYLTDAHFEANQKVTAQLKLLLQSLDRN